MGIEARPQYPQVDAVALPGDLTVSVGDELLVKLPGQTAKCIVKVVRIDLEEENGPVRDFTVAVWKKKSGREHLQRGVVRTLTPEQVAASLQS